MCRSEKVNLSSVVLVAHLIAVLIAGCGPPGPPLPPEESVTPPTEGSVYIHVEAPRRLAGPILATFTSQTGIEVEATYFETAGDGFLDHLKAEARAGRADLFWGTSPLWAIDLQRAGLTAPFRPVQARPIPSQYHDRDFHWAGFAVNPRVIIYNNELVSRREAPQSLYDLTRAPWGGKGAMARITRGTAAFHAAALFSLWGAERARDFFEAVEAHGNYIVDDDAAVLELVSSGVAHWGFIDLDLGICAMRNAQPVHIFFPDRLSLGAMTPPHVMSMLADAPNPAQAKALFAYLFSTEAAWQVGQDDCALMTLLPNIPKPEWVPVLGGGERGPDRQRGALRRLPRQRGVLRLLGCRRLPSLTALSLTSATFA